MGGGRKRKQPGNASAVNAGGFPPEKPTHKTSLPPNNNKKKTTVKKKQGDMESWITNLARQATDSTGDTLPSTTKKERQEKRAAKKQKRQQQKEMAVINSSTTSNNPTEKYPAPTSNNLTAAKPKTYAGTTSKSQIRLRLLAKECKDAIRRQQKSTTKSAYARRKPFQGYTDATTRRRKRGKKWDEDTVQPRPNDYGGLGLALPSLYLCLEDPSFQARLEEEFQEHIDGFFGKQRTKAMKKQLDGQMLWRQLQRSKNQPQNSSIGNNKVDGKKLADMTPDQRVEAMLEAGML